MEKSNTKSWILKMETSFQFFQEALEQLYRRKMHLKLVFKQNGKDLFI